MQIFGERLREERERLGVSQQALADACGISMRSQRNYEIGVRVPDATYLLGAASKGIDVLYVVTGAYIGDVAPAPAMNDDERELLALYRAAPLAVKMAAVGALEGGASASSAPRNIRQTARGGSHNIQVGHAGQFINAPPTKRGRK